MREMGVELQPRQRAAQQTGQRLLAHLKRLSPQVIAVKLQEIKATRKTSGSWLRCLSLSKLATPCSLQHTASPSIRQLRTFSLFTARTISG